jgi:hypothetical protein
MHCYLCGKEIENSLYKKCTKCSGRGSTKCQLNCTTCYATRGTCNTCFGLDNTARLYAAAMGSSSSSEEEAPSDNQRFLSTAEQTATALAADQQQQGISQAASSLSSTAEKESTTAEVVGVQGGGHLQTAQSADVPAGEQAVETENTTSAVSTNTGTEATAAAEQQGITHQEQQGISILIIKQTI